MAIKKQARGHADPLLEEVVCGLEETLKEIKVDAPRGVGDRTFSGDPLLKVVEDYHHHEHVGDHPDLASRVALQEDLLLKRHKKNSLFTTHLEGTYDPILQEYVMPHQTLVALKAFEDDMKKKQALFKEMAERRHNLESREVLLKHTKVSSQFVTVVNSFHQTNHHKAQQQFCSSVDLCITLKRCMTQSCTSMLFRRKQN